MPEKGRYIYIYICIEILLSEQGKCLNYSLGLAMPRRRRPGFPTPKSLKMPWSVVKAPCSYKCFLKIKWPKHERTHCESEIQKKKLGVQKRYLICKGADRQGYSNYRMTTGNSRRRPEHARFALRSHDHIVDGLFQWHPNNMPVDLIARQEIIPGS